MIRYRSANGRGAEKSRLVTAVAIRRIECVIVVYMARRARSRRRRRVRSSQGEPGNTVIEGRCRPARCRMAMGTIRWGKGGAGSGVHRSIGLSPSCQMATRVTAIGWGDRQVVVVIDVAQIAGHIGVPVGQEEPGGAVIERGTHPTDGRMTRRTIRKCKRGPGRWMDGICGLLPGCQMASRVPAIGRCDGQVIVVIDMTKSASDIRVAIG
jgi:hypothetical protein